jgi:hypothetical protein
MAALLPSVVCSSAFLLHSHAFTGIRTQPEKLTYLLWEVATSQAVVTPQNPLLFSTLVAPPTRLMQNILMTLP